MRLGNGARGSANISGPKGRALFAGAGKRNLSRPTKPLRGYSAKNGRVPERSIGAVLKTVRAKARAGSNPAPSLFFALGAYRGMLYRFKDYLSPKEIKQLKAIDHMVTKAMNDGSDNEKNNRRGR